MSATIRNEMEMEMNKKITMKDPIILNLTRCVATTRSCNDDYCPQMNALIVKFELLNLKADPKMEAYDAAQDRAFYEDKTYDETFRDEDNDVTFGEDADTEYKFEDEDEEVRHFNEERGTKFTREQYNIFERYVEDNYLEVVDALDYIQGCHNCGKQLDIFGNDYCNKRCCEFIEDYRYPCFRGADCLICHGYPTEDVKDNNCYWGPDCVHCAAYSGHEEDRFCLDCVECEKPMTAHEGYTIDGETWCNLCVESLDNIVEDEEDNSNDSKKRKRDSDDDEEDEDDDNDSDEDDDNDSDADDEMPTKRKCVSNETWIEWADLQNESADLWHLALEISNGDKDAAIDMLEDEDTLMSHPTIIEYMRSKEQRDDNAMDLDISNEETVDDSDDEIIYNAMDFDASDDETENVDAYVEPDYDYAESVVDYDEDVSEIPNQELYNAVVRLDDENAMLRQELEDLRNERQRRIVFPLGSSITFVDEDGIRYLQVSNINQEVNNGPLTMADLEEDQEQSDQDDIENEFNMYC